MKNGSTVVIDSKGELSLDGNILAIMLPPLHTSVESPLLKVFRLDEDATPHLLLERTSSREDWMFGEGDLLDRAWVKSGWLVTVERINDSPSIKLCLESIEQIISK